MLRKTGFVHILPTEKASRLKVRTGNGTHHPDYLEGYIQYSQLDNIPDPEKLWQNHLLYFTAPSIEEDKVNGEEIKLNDFFIQKDGGNEKPILRKFISKSDYSKLIRESGGIIHKIADKYGYYPTDEKSFVNIIGNQKVIATINSELWEKKNRSWTAANEWDYETIKGVAKIPSDFIEVFVKEQGKIGRVGLEYESINDLESGLPQFGGYDLPDTVRPKLNNNGAVKVYPVEEKITKEIMYSNMQYYMEYCQSNGYVTPMDWLHNFKHF